MPGQSLAMPIKLAGGGDFGTAMHALQVVASWSQCKASEDLIVLPPEFSENRATQSRFATTLPGMAALYFSPGILSGTRKISRFDALSLVAPMVAAMQSASFANTVRGKGIALCCFAGAKNEYLRILYSRPEAGGVRGAAEFRILTGRMLGTLSSKLLGSMTENQLSSISELVHQLFRNSDEHGSYGVDGRRYESSIRGVTLRLTNIADEALRSGDTPLQAYLSRLRLPDETKRKTTQAMSSTGAMQLAELTVFDTGPGLALRWLSDKIDARSYDDFSLTEEREAVQTCFAKHATTKSNQLYGQGLDSSLKAMKELRAFMTVRTGRLSLYQDFSRGDTHEFRASDRFPASELTPISGTAYSIYLRVK